MRIVHWVGALFLPIIVTLSVISPGFAYAQVATTASIDPHNSADVEADVRQYFADIPAMIPIAKCESGFRQYGPDGLVLFDPSYSMIGVFQISAAHMPEAYQLGMDVTTLGGNLAYARYLYQTNGIDPWMSSFGCWGSLVKSSSQVLGTSTSALPAAPSSSISYSLGMSSATILTVQQMLNKAGFILAASGPGSVGNETTMFGSLTRAAVRRFQCAQNIVCSGDESTTGYGVVDDRTYNALVALTNGSSAQPPASPVTPPAATQASTDKAAQIANIQSQISSLTNQLNVLNTQLNQLMQ